MKPNLGGKGLDCSDSRRLTLPGTITVMLLSGCSSLAMLTSLNDGYVGYCGLKTSATRFTQVLRPHFQRLQ
jgi:uncharacterized protein YceK